MPQLHGKGLHKLLVLNGLHSCFVKEQSDAKGGYIKKDVISVIEFKLRYDVIVSYFVIFITMK